MSDQSSPSEASVPAVAPEAAVTTAETASTALPTDSSAGPVDKTPDDASDAAAGESRQRALRRRGRSGNRAGGRSDDRSEGRSPSSRNGASGGRATERNGARNERSSRPGQRPARGDSTAATPARGGRHHPMLDVLAQLHPALFGEQPLPLKRGIFQDLTERHGEQLPTSELKIALGLHTRSTRYLTAVAAGEARHDLDGQAVEPMAPEHVHHALLEVFKRRQQRTQEDLTPKLRRRLVQAFEASGLAREDYALLVRHKDESVNLLLDDALSEAAATAARDEALLRAYEASGQTVQAFAEAYGRDPRQVQRSVDDAARRRLKTLA